MRRNSVIASTILTISLLLVGCGGSSYMPPPPPPPPSTQPMILAISPTNVPAGTGNFTLTVTGKNLGMTSLVQFGGGVFTPSSMAPVSCPGGGSCTALAVDVPAQYVASAATITVSVINGSVSSNLMAFAVTPQSGTVAGAPQLLLLSPMVAPANGTSFQLVVEAQNAAQGAMVNFGSLSLSPTSTLMTFYPPFAAISTLTVQIPASALTTPGAVTVSVTNPGSSGGTSNPGNFFVVSKSSFPIEESLSNAPPVAGNAPSTHSSVGIDGFLVVFDSTATNLLPGATSALSQVYTRVNCFGTAATCVANQTRLVSAAPDGSPGAGGTKGSEKPAISPDGRFIVFQSDDTNLVPGVTQPIDQIYLRDTCESNLGAVPNCTPGTALVSAQSPGVPGNGPSTNPVVGAFGLFVAFQSSATNLVSQSVPSGVQQVYLWSGCNGSLLGALPDCFLHNIALESVDTSGNAGDKDSTNPSIDAGLVVAFQSLADNIVANTPGNGFQQIYERATCLALASSLQGSMCGNNARAVSVDANGKLGAGDSVTPAVSTFGMLAVFATRAPNLLPANTSSEQVVAASTCFAVPPIPCPASSGGVTVISVDQNGMPGQGDSFHPTLSGQALVIGSVAFTSKASLNSGVTDQQVYASNFCLLCARPQPPFSIPLLVSADSTGKPMGGDFGALDLTGQFATFSSIGPGATSGPTQIFLAAPFF